MHLDPRSCYKALRSRDYRYDGRFFVGVKTTGIYCRPVCPARAALYKNVAFYRTAAEAEEEGFRPCKRCRPESAAGSQASSRAHSRPRLDSDYTPPRNETEQVLARIWQEFLGISEIGINDDLFELGADSLLATQAMSRVREILEVDLPMASVFEEPTVAGLAGLVDAAKPQSMRSRSASTKREEGEV